MTTIDPVLEDAWNKIITQDKQIQALRLKVQQLQQEMTDYRLMVKHQFEMAWKALG